MNFIFITVYVIWLLSETVLNRMLHSKSTDRPDVDKNSLPIIWITIAVAMFLTTYVAINFYFPIYDNPDFKYLGLGIIALGIVLRLTAVLSLGRFFTVDVTIREDHKLKTDGVYKYLRHPSYFASLLSFIGYGIAMNSWPGLLIIFISILTVFIYRIKIEEKILIEQFGETYIKYKKSTKGIIPFIY